jgi:hypothetical protein
VDYLKLVVVVELVEYDQVKIYEEELRVTTQLELEEKMIIP